MSQTIWYLCLVLLFLLFININTEDSDEITNGQHETEDNDDNNIDTTHKLE